MGGRDARILAGAHPRSRGDHTPPTVPAPSLTGSSPLARGPLWQDAATGHVRGLIPARAGTTSQLWPYSTASRAHPRSRGDHLKVVVRHISRAGSSPLARGPPCAADGYRRRSGLIPARAGTTKNSHGLHCKIRAHPRSRGDHCYRPAILRMGEGSSPLARGPRVEAAKAGEVYGLIPARAGTTIIMTTSSQKERAHPRSRGDHVICAVQASLCRGSSPLARGPHTTGLFASCALGLIPARAGTTYLAADTAHTARAHPRSRGDHAVTTILTTALAGSSPLARGPRDVAQQIGVTAGLIPARAGTTSYWCRFRIPWWAHPRSRGDHAGASAP